MQWLINIINELFDDRHRYFDRGDPNIWDFGMLDLTLDGAWHTLDLSAIVPANAVAVSLKVNLRNTAIHKKFDLRKTGNAQAYCTCALWTQVANIRIGGVFVVSCSESRSIDYISAVGGWTSINLQVNGWWLR